jgi:hypothetical protein
LSKRDPDVLEALRFFPRRGFYLVRSGIVNTGWVPGDEFRVPRQWVRIARCQLDGPEIGFMARINCCQQHENRRRNYSYCFHIFISGVALKATLKQAPADHS